MDCIAHAAEMSMKAAIEEVQSLPHYEEAGEVIVCFLVYSQVSTPITDSGLSLMQGMTPLPMPITLRYLASLEGISCSTEQANHDLIS